VQLQYKWLTLLYFLLNDVKIDCELENAIRWLGVKRLQFKTNILFEILQDFDTGR